MVGDVVVDHFLQALDDALEDLLQGAGDAGEVLADQGRDEHGRQGRQGRVQQVVIALQNRQGRSMGEAEPGVPGEPQHLGEPLGEQRCVMFHLGQTSIRRGVFRFLEAQTQGLEENAGHEEKDPQGQR